MNSLSLSKTAHVSLTDVGADIGALFDSKAPLDEMMPDIHEDVEFVETCKSFGVCLDGHCVAHSDAAEEEESDEHLFRLYLSGHAMEKDWVTSGMVAEYTKNMLKSEDFRRNVFDAIGLRATKACEQVSLTSDGVEEYSVINGMQPYVYKKKGEKHGVADYFFSSGVAFKNDLSVVVPRSLYTALHHVEMKRDLCDSHGLPHSLVRITEELPSKFANNIKKTCEIDIFTKRDNEVGGKRKNEVCRTLGVIPRVSKFKVITESVKIRNPSVLFSYEKAEAVSDIVDLPAEDDSDDEEDEDDDRNADADAENVLDFATDRLKAATLKTIVEQDTVQMCFSPIKNCHNSVNFGVKHYFATIFTSNNEQLLQMLVVVKTDVDSPLTPTIDDSPGLVEKGRRSFVFSEDAMCFLLPPALTELQGPMTTGKVSVYTLKQDGTYKPAATREFFADFRVAFLVNTHATFDAVNHASYDLAVLHDLVHRVHGNKRKVSTYTQALEKVLKCEKDSIDPLIKEQTAAHDELLQTHKTRMIAATAMGVQLISGIKRLYAQWYYAKDDDEEVEEDLQTTMNAALCVFGYAVDDCIKRGSSDDDKMMFHHDKELVTKINRTETMARNMNANRERDAVLFVKLIEKRVLAEKFEKMKRLFYLPRPESHQAPKILTAAAVSEADDNPIEEMEEEEVVEDDTNDLDTDSEIDPDEEGA